MCLFSNSLVGKPTDGCERSALIQPLMVPRRVLLECRPLLDFPVTRPLLDFVLCLSLRIETLFSQFGPWDLRCGSPPLCLGPSGELWRVCFTKTIHPTLNQLYSGTSQHSPAFTPALSKPRFFLSPGNYVNQWPVFGPSDLRASIIISI